MRAPVLLAAFLVFGAVPGCLKVDSETKIRADGGGVFTRTVTVEMENARAFQRAIVQQARSALPIAPEDGETDPFADLDPKRWEAALKHAEGIRIVTNRRHVDKKKKVHTHSLQLEFDSLEALFKAGVIDDVSVRLSQDEKSRAWTLRIRHVFDGVDREPETGEAAERFRKMRLGMLKRYEKWWGNLEIVSSITLPTKITKTNGTKAKEGNTVSWRIGFEDLADPRRLTQVVTFAHPKDSKLVAFELSANEIANAIEAAAIAAEEEEKKKKAGKK